MTHLKERKQRREVRNLEVCNLKLKGQGHLTKALKEVKEKGLWIFGVKAFQAKVEQQVQRPRGGSMHGRLKHQAESQCGWSGMRAELWEMAQKSNCFKDRSRWPSKTLLCLWSQWVIRNIYLSLSEKKLHHEKILSSISLEKEWEENSN